MNGPRENRRFARPMMAALAIVAGCGAWALAPTPAAARIFIGVGFGLPLFPGAYWPYYPPYPYYYPPPPAYAYYPAPAAPLPAPGAPPPAAAAAPNAAITYTSRPAFTNAAGQPCREYTATRGSQQVFGTACRDAGGQWRIIN